MEKYEELNDRIYSRYNSLIKVEADLQRESKTVKVNTTITLVLLISLIAIPDYFLMVIFIVVTLLCLFSYCRWNRLSISASREHEILDHMIHRRNRLYVD